MCQTIFIVKELGKRFSASFEKCSAKLVLALALFLVVTLGCDSKNPVSKFEPIGRLDRTNVANTTEELPREPVVATSTKMIAVKTAKNDSTKKVVAEKPKEKANPKLHKNFTTLMLAYQPDIRARQLLLFVRDVLTPEQDDEAIALLLEHDHEFQKIIEKRAIVLNNAVQGDDTLSQLENIKHEIVELSNRLRQMVFKNILTAEQKAQRKKETDAARLAKQLEESAKKKR